VSWKGEYAFGAEEAARTGPAGFLAAVEVERKAAELVRAAEAVVCSERVYVVQIMYPDF
jgi:hypothetical protein